MEKAAKLQYVPKIMIHSWGPHPSHYHERGKGAPSLGIAICVQTTGRCIGKKKAGNWAHVRKPPPYEDPKTALSDSPAHIIKLSCVNHPPGSETKLGLSQLGHIPDLDRVVTVVEQSEINWKLVLSQVRDKAMGWGWK